MIWMLDTNILVYFTNRKPGFEKIARRMSGRTPGEVRLSAITLAELRFGIARGEFRAQNEAALDGLLEFLQVDDFPAGAAGDFGESFGTKLGEGLNRPIFSTRHSSLVSRLTNIRYGCGAEVKARLKSKSAGTPLLAPLRCSHVDPL
jgi:predicted nucleic acid-binding protein